MTITELNEKKTTESAKLQRITERVHGARVAREDAETVAARLDSALRTEQENAVLNELAWPTPDAEKKLSAARAKLVSADSALSAAMGAMERQAATVEGIEGEITGRRMEIFEAELAPAKERLFHLMSEFCSAACCAEQIAQRHGISPYRLAAVLYPSTDGFTGFSERNARIGLINGGCNLTAFLRNNYVGREV
jgi:hypothetical protein